jgi:hypothetical protein
VDGRELVVVSTSVDPATLGELVQKHTPDDFKKLASHHRRVL